MHQTKNDQSKRLDATRPSQGAGDHCRIGGARCVDGDIVHPSDQMAGANTLCRRISARWLGGDSGEPNSQNIGCQFNIKRAIENAVPRERKESPVASGPPGS
jgi:hypothetical protein